jgi:hypothetical protein
LETAAGVVAVRKLCLRGGDTVGGGAQAPRGVVIGVALGIGRGGTAAEGPLTPVFRPIATQTPTTNARPNEWHG